MSYSQRALNNLLPLGQATVGATVQGLSSLASEEPKLLEPRQFSAGGDVEDSKGQHEKIQGPVFVQPSPSAMAQAAGAAALGARAPSPENKAEVKKRMASAATGRPDQAPLGAGPGISRLGLSAMQRSSSRGGPYGSSHPRSMALRRAQGPPHGQPFVPVNHPTRHAAQQYGGKAARKNQDLNISGAGSPKAG